MKMGSKLKEVKRIYHLVAVLFLVVNHSFTQKNPWEPAYTNFSVDDGLPSSETYYVHQDRNNYMWFCTDRGVVRYDGFRFEVFNKSNGLPDEVVFKIIEDEAGRVWFYLYSGKLAYYDPLKKKIFPYKYNHILNKLNHGDFNHQKWFSVDKDDNVYYVGVYQSGYIDKNGKCVIYKAKNDLEVEQLGDGVWIKTGNRREIGKKELHFIWENGQEICFKSKNNIVRFDFLDMNGCMFLFVDDELVNLNNPSRKTSFEGYTGMYNLNGELWITTLTGVHRFINPKNADLTKPNEVYLSDQKVSSVTKDSEGGYWFSTLDKGIYYTPCLDIINWVPEKENQGAILDIEGIGNNLYYSSVFGYYNLKTGEKLLEVKGAKNPIGVWNDKLILSSNIPLTVSKSVTKKKWGLIVAQFQAWTTDRENNFYAAYVVPFRIRKNTEVEEELLKTSQIYSDKKFSPHYFKSFAFDSNGELYAGSLIGLFRLRKGSVKKCKLPGDLERIRITSLKFHEKWGLIAATRGSGIILLKNEKLMGKIREKDGLLSDQLNAMYVDRSGVIYVASNEGISKIVQLENHQIRIYNLTELNGLASAEISAVFSNKKGVYLGTRKGISLIPSSYLWTKTSHQKQISIQTVFTSGKKVVNFRNGMEFNSSHKIIRFLLRTSNYKSQHKQSYKYRFRKTDPWSVGFNGELIMINPAFEKYELEIKYLNEYGSWSKPYILARFSILPPFYSTWWFTSLIILLILTISFLFFGYRLKVVQRRNQIQQEMALLEQKALLAQMNPHFIFNALNSIQSFLLYNENELAERYLLKLSKLIRLTLSNSRETEISIQKEIESLQMYLELEQMRFKNRFEFHINTALSKEQLNKFVPPMLIQPFAENAIIHGFKGLEKGGKIDLNFKEIFNNRLIVEIMDNGVGYTKNKSLSSDHKSYATQITSERLNLFKERYQAEFDFSIEILKGANESVQGTKVIISIPVFSRD